MMGWLIFLGIMIVYFTVSAVLVRVKMPRMWRIADRNWSSRSGMRSSVKAQSVLWFLLWPGMLPITTTADYLDKVVDRHDPQRIEKEMREQRLRIRQQENHIRDLERELGVGQ